MKLFIHATIFLSAISSSWADTQNFAPGMMCRAVAKEQIDRIDAERSKPHFIRSRGSASDEKDDIPIVCPIVNLGGAAITSVKVYLQHPDKRSTRCSFSSAAIETGTDTIVRSFDFPNKDEPAAGEIIGNLGQINVAKPNSTYILTCNLARNTVLKGYSWAQK